MRGDITSDTADSSLRHTGKDGIAQFLKHSSTNPRGTIGEDRSTSDRSSSATKRREVNV